MGDKELEFGDQQSQQILFFHIKELDYQIPANNIKLITKGHIYDPTLEAIVYSITVQYKDYTEVTVPFDDEDLRDKEHLNLLSKLEEYRYLFV